MANQSSAPVSADERASRIRALIAGELDPEIAVDSLFRVSLAGSDGLRLRAVARMIADDEFFQRAKDDIGVLSNVSDGQARLALAEATFLRLPESRRNALLAAQRKKHEQFTRAADAEKSEEAELARLTSELAGLRDFLDGKPVNPAVLSVNLVNQGKTDAGLGLMTEQPPDPVPQPSPDASIAERTAWLRSEIARTRRQIMRLDPQRLAALETAAGLNSNAADAIALAEAEIDAARSQLDAAERAAVNAANEHERLVASERARLLQVRQAQAEFRSNLAKAGAQPDIITENALSWRRRALEAARSDDAAADTLYAQLVDELAAVRRRLRAALDTEEHPSLQNLRPQPVDTALPSETPETEALMQGVRALDRQADALRAEYSARLWEQRVALRDAMDMMNEARLALLASLSRSKRASVTGFGAEGVSQVRRELAEIVLEVRFHLQAWRRTLDTTTGHLARPSPGFVLAMLRIVAILLLFGWWRRRGDLLLARAQLSAGRKRPSTMLRSFKTAFLGYWRRIKGPLDWLLLTVCIWWLWPAELNVAGLRIVWIVLAWSLVTVVVVRLVDELARGHGREDPRAALRWKSLRLVAGSALAVGLLLNLARASVGRGAIYHWVSTFAWVLVPVIAVLLAHWWRARIVALSKAEAGDSSMLKWVATDPGGVSGLIGRIFVGIVLLLRGFRSIFARRVRDVALVREMLEQRARADAERQVAQDKASGRYQHLSPEILSVFEPHRLPAMTRLGEERPGHSPVRDIAPGSLTLIVGERGLGKSSLLSDISEKLADTCRTIAFSVPPDPGADMLDELAREVGLTADGRTGDEQVLVTVDDIQRLVLPAIGGLATLDRLVALARSSGSNYRWAFTISQEAWRFLQRARSERILFDAVINLPHWPVAEIRALIERRTEQAGITPDFSAMVDEGVFEFGEDISPIERKKRGYFERLTEYANGNPAIALDYWRRSLFVDHLSDDNVTVRTFDTPPVESLAALPMSALFVLRVILLMDIASKDAIRTSTDLSDMLVTDALRRLERMRAITNQNGAYQISLHWWIEVVRLLARQNLIVRSAK